jgi:hypothetical protein
MVPILFSNDKWSRTLDEVNQSRLSALLKECPSPENHWLIAHAAFPVALTSDLLYKIWVNFRTADEAIETPLFTVAQILHSPIFREVSRDLYEMFPPIRTALLCYLKDQEGWGHKRLIELAQFLQAYVDHCREKIPSAAFAEAQRWIANTYLNPDRAAETLLHSIDEGVKKGWSSTRINYFISWARQMGLNVDDESSSVSNSKLDSLGAALQFVEGVQAYRTGNTDKALKKLEKLKDLFSNPITATDKCLQTHLPKSIWEKLGLKKQDERKQDNQQNEDEIRRTKIAQLFSAIDTRATIFQMITGLLKRRVEIENSERKDSIAGKDNNRNTDVVLAFSLKNIEHEFRVEVIDKHGNIITIGVTEEYHFRASLPEGVYTVVLPEEGLTSTFELGNSEPFVKVEISWMFNKKWILVVGTSGNLTREEASITEKVGELLAEEGYGLIIGAYDGVDSLAGSSYLEYLRKKGVLAKDYLIQVLKQDQRLRSYSLDDYSIKEVGSDSEWDKAVLEKASAIIVIGGLGYPYKFCQRAHDTSLPIIPIPASGRDAKRVFDEIVRSKNSLLPYDLVSQLAIDISSDDGLNRITQKVLQLLSFVDLENKRKLEDIDNKKENAVLVVEIGEAQLGVEREFETIRHFTGIKTNLWYYKSFSFKDALESLARYNHVSALHFTGYLVDNREIYDKSYHNSLMNWINARHELKLIFLNGSNTENIALMLMETQAPYVIYTKNNVSDSDAASVATQFYSNLTRGFNVRDAFELTRAYYLSKEKQESFDWILYEKKYLNEDEKKWSLIPDTKIGTVDSGSYYNSSLTDWLRYAPKPQELTEGNEWNVFISYRSANRSWVLSLYDILCGLGFKVFIDQKEIRAGDNYIIRLEDALTKSQSAVLVWSNATNDSEWVRNEYSVLEKLSKKGKDFRFVPIILENVKLPVFAKNRVFLNFSSYPDGPNGTELLRLLFAIVGKPLSPDAIHFANEQDELVNFDIARIDAAIQNKRPERLMQLFEEGGLPWKMTPVLGCKVVDGLIKLGRYDDAIYVLEILEKQFPHATRPKQLRALAFVRRGKVGDLESAQDILGEMYNLGQQDSETLGIYARTWMDLYKKSGDQKDLERSRDLYSEAFEKAPDDYYAGINAAAESIFLGEEANFKKATEYARRVQNILGDKAVAGDYWRTVIAAEAFLIQRKYEQAGRLYKEALDMDSSDTGSHTSTWQQASRLMEKLKPLEQEKKLIISAFQHLAEVRVQVADGETDGNSLFKENIFLSIPNSIEAKKRRRLLIYQAEAKAKYENWPYEIVPTTSDMEEIEAMSDEEKEDTIATLIQRSVYSIHIIESENELKDGLGKLQYEIAKEYHANLSNAVNKSIVWLLRPDLKYNVDKSLLMNPLVTGYDYENLFDKIKTLDDQRIVSTKKIAAKGGIIYLLFDYSRDYENNLRIRLKSALEERNFLIRMPRPKDNFVDQKKDLELCDAAIIFYGAAEPEWFHVAQAYILSIRNLHFRAVCIDKLEIERKLKYDVDKANFFVLQPDVDFNKAVEDFSYLLVEHK